MKYDLSIEGLDADALLRCVEAARAPDRSLPSAPRVAFRRDGAPVSEGDRRVGRAMPFLPDAERLTGESMQAFAERTGAVPTLNKAGCLDPAAATYATYATSQES